MPREIDEDLIEATIRRVAAEAESATPRIEMPVAEAVAPDFFNAPPAADREPESQPDEVAPSDGDEADPVGVILARLDALGQQIDELSARVGQIAAALGPLTAPSRASNGAPYPAPNVTPMTPRAPAYPGSSRAATAEQLEPQVIDTRPIPKPLPPLEIEPRRGLDLLPRTYRITVEDKRRGVDLVPLHRALLSMDGVRDMALLSYNNGVAIVSLEVAGDLNPDALAQSVGSAMSRDARAEVHNEHTMVVKLAED